MDDSKNSVLSIGDRSIASIKAILDNLDNLTAEEVLEQLHLALKAAFSKY